MKFKFQKEGKKTHFYGPKQILVHTGYSPEKLSWFALTFSCFLQAKPCWHWPVESCLQAQECVKAALQSFSTTFDFFFLTFYMIVLNGWTLYSVNCQFWKAWLKKNRNLNGCHINLNFKIATDTIYNWMCWYLFHNVRTEYSKILKPIKKKKTTNISRITVFQVDVYFLYHFSDRCPMIQNHIELLKKSYWIIHEKLVKFRSNVIRKYFQNMIKPAVKQCTILYSSIFIPRKATLIWAFSFGNL